MSRLEQRSERLAVLILGVQRSGTSALTRTLSMGGLQLPKTLIEPNLDNPRGFWESDIFLLLNRRILAACRSNDSDILPVSERRLASEPVRQLEGELERALDSEIGEVSRCLIKDPRICRLFPIWQRILDRLGWQYRVIIPVRHPAEVIGSMNYEGPLARSRAQLVWLQGFLAAEQASRRVRRSFITFDQLLEDPVRHAVRLSDELSLKLEFGEEVCSQIRQFLNHRPRNRMNEFVRDRQVLPMCRAAFDWAQAQAGGTPSPVRIERIQRGYRIATTTLGPVIRASRWILESTRNRNRSERSAT